MLRVPILRISRPFYPLCSPSLYTTFWTLSAYDLHVPKSAYNREIESVNQKKQQLDQEAGRDMRETRKRKEVERCNQMIQKFKGEEKAQAEHVARVLAKLDHDKGTWFKACKSNHVSLWELGLIV